MRGMQETRGMFTRIPGNLLEDSGEVIVLTFRGMFEEILGNVQEDSGECSKRFRGMFKKIPGNAQEGFGESKFNFFLVKSCLFFIKFCN